MPTMTLKAGDGGNGIGVAVVEQALRMGLYFSAPDLLTNKKFIYETDSYRLEAQGNGFKQIDGLLVAGTIKKMVVTELSAIRGEVTLADITNFGDVKGLAKAMAKAKDKLDGGFIEDYIHKLKWDIDGSPGNDRLDNDTFSGSHNFTASNVIRMADGNDFVEAGGGNDKAYGGNGQDFLAGDKGNDKLFGGNDGDEIEGGAGRDKIVGGNDDDFLYGGDGNDKIKGGTGRDQIEGGGGNDKMLGGKDADTFIFKTPDRGNLGMDTILGYNAGEDSILLSGVSRIGADQVSNGVLLEHSEGTILIKGGDIDDFASWDI